VLSACSGAVLHDGDGEEASFAEAVGGQVAFDLAGRSSGLTAEYYDNVDFTNLKVTRTEANLSHDWGNGSPDSSIGPDQWSARYTGVLVAPKSGRYRIATVSDDGIRVWLSGNLTIDNWTNHGPTENAATLDLSAGQAVPLKVEFYEAGGGAVLRLSWTTPDGVQETIPASAFVSPAPSTEQPAASGLLAQYFDNVDFTNLKLNRIDTKIDNDWGSGSPDPSIAPDQWSARFTGALVAPKSGSYRIATVSDDGVRLWLSGNLVISDWTDHGSIENSTTLNLTAGQSVPLKLEYYDAGGGAVLRMRWRTPDGVDEIIPASAFKQTTTPVVDPPLPPPVQPPPPSTAGAIVLPVEVMGEGAVVSVKANAGNGSSAARVFLRVNNLSYENEASIKLNGCAWLPLNSSTVQFSGLGATYGGFNKVINTTTLTVAAPGCGVNGDNTVQFRFDKTDRVSSGFRVLAFNLQNSGGSDLISGSAFVRDNPNDTSRDNWKVPQPGAVAAGKDLWEHAGLKQYPRGPSSAVSCNGCHGSGHDLKYFNYSNRSIIERSRFHGLSVDQGEKIASYLRTLNAPNPGRVEDPPFQPGPGLDGKSAADFSAGAGLASVYEDGTALAHMPGGLQTSTFASGRTQYPHFKEYPIEIQLLDWNHHLPPVHPRDVFPGFAGSETEQILDRIRQRAQASAHDYVVKGEFESDLKALAGSGGTPILNATPTCDRGRDFECITDKQAQIDMYSFFQFRWTHLWDIVRTNNLEQYCPEANAYRGRQANGGYDTIRDPESRCFIPGNNRLLFELGVHLNRIGGGDGQHAYLFGDKSNNRALWGYQTAAWYHAQIIANSGSRRFGTGSTSPVDWQYSWFYVSWVARNQYGYKPNAVPALALATQVAATWNGNNAFGVRGTNVDGNGFSFRGMNPAKLVALANWQLVPSNLRSAALNAGLDAWLQVAESYPAGDWYRTDQCGDNGPLNSGTSTHSTCGDGHAAWNYNHIPSARDLGVDNAIINRWSDVMQNLFPNDNFRQFKR